MDRNPICGKMDAQKQLNVPLHQRAGLSAPEVAQADGDCNTQFPAEAACSEAADPPARVNVLRGDENVEKTCGWGRTAGASYQDADGTPLAVVLGNSVDYAAGSAFRCAVSAYEVFAERAYTYLGNRPNAPGAPDPELGALHAPGS